jgi:hypothetical protein
MGARLSLAGINLFIHAPRTRKSKNGLCANTALCPRAPGLCAAKRSLASPRQGMHPRRIHAHQTRSRRLNKLSATSGCSERIKLSGARGSSRYRSWRVDAKSLPKQRPRRASSSVGPLVMALRRRREPPEAGWSLSTKQAPARNKGVTQTE